MNFSAQDIQDLKRSVWPRLVGCPECKAGFDEKCKRVSRDHHRVRIIKYLISNFNEKFHGKDIEKLIKRHIWA